MQPSLKCENPLEAASIWFEIWGSWIRVKMWIFPGKFPKNFDFFTQFHKKSLDFPGKNWPFTATFGQGIF